MSVRARLTLLPLVLVLGSLTACSADHTEDAEALMNQVSAMDAVKAVDLSYDWGNVLLPGSVTFEVTMQPDAKGDAAANVIGTVFEEFASTYRTQEGSLSVLMSDDSEILVHTNQPDAETADVVAVARFALGARGKGETVEADINARDDAGLEELASDVRLSLAPGSTRSDVLPRIAGFAVAGGLPAHTDFGVIAADGAGLAGSRGLPSDDDRRVWRELSRVDFAGTMRVESGPYQIYDDVRRYGFANVTVTRPRGGPLAQVLAPLMRAHLAVLGSNRDHFVYRVTVNGDDTIWLDSRNCNLDGFPAWQAEVIREFLKSTDACQDSTK